MGQSPFKMVWLCFTQSQSRDWPFLHSELLEKEAWPRLKKLVPVPKRRGRGGQFGEIFRPKHFAELLLRLRPMGSRFAPPRLRRFGGFATFIDAAATPPFQGGEYCAHCNSFTRSLARVGERNV